ncbi:MAG: DUF2029 domain-containing protein [Actinobacteria bacterium]|nr:DUF2029 domain-containing protein [Actinomycetota bacterium]
MTQRRWSVLAAAGFAGLLVCSVVGWRLGGLDHARWPRAWVYAGQWTAFVVGALAIRRVSGSRVVSLIVLGGALLQLLAVLWPPRTTDDFYRYLWDGRVQAHGIDPYRYAPIDPALTSLRDPWLFPGPGDHTLINHRAVPTIYPPVAQLYFLLVHLVPGERRLPLQLAAALLAVATSMLLVVATRRTGVDPRAVVWWAWCPTVVLEAGNDAHVDVLGAFFCVAGLAVLAGRIGERSAGRSRAGLAAGALLGAAVGVKFLPGLLGPALARHRWRWALLGGATAVLAGSYLPHLLAVGPRVFGFLPGYLAEERFSGADRYPLLGLLLPGPVAAVAGVAVIAAVALAVWWRADPARPVAGGVVLVGVTFCVLAPEYPWYALVLVVLAALADQARWLAIAAAGWPAYLVGSLHLPIVGTRAVSYGTAALLVLAVWLIRRRVGTVTGC